MSTLETWVFGAVFAVAVVSVLAYHFPRFSAYFLGPAFLVLGAGSFITLHKYFFPFQSDGSIAGLIVPVILWLWLVGCCVLGTVLIVVGLKRTKRRASTVVESDA